MTKATRTILVLCIFLLTVLAKPWVPAAVSPNNNNSTSQLFTHVFVPKESSTVYVPINSHYMVYKLPYFTEYIDLCANNETLYDCVDYFCSTMPTTTTTNATHHTRMMNYCHYCAFATRSTCATPFGNVTATDICGANNYLIATHYLYNNTKGIPPFMCYCTEWDLVGFRCDGYTRAGFTIAWEVTSSLILIASCFGVILVGLLLCVPECAQRMPALQKKQFSVLLNVQMHAVAFLTLSFLFNFAEQVYGLLYHAQYGSGIRAIPVPGGLFRTTSFTFTMLSYASCLIRWSNIYWRVKQLSNRSALDTKHKVLLGIYYAVVIICLLITGILFVALRNPAIVFPIAGCFLLLFFLVFPVGFSIYAVGMYCILRNTASAGNLKTTRFTLMLNFVYFIVYGVCTPVVVTYFAGWDVAGVWYGVFRNPVIDSSNLCIAMLLLYVLFNSKLFTNAYRRDKNKPWLETPIPVTPKTPVALVKREQDMAATPETITISG